MVASSGSDEQSSESQGPKGQTRQGLPSKDISAERHFRVSVVVTLYNEEDNVERMSRNLAASLRDHLAGVPFELILVLNGPSDRTPERAEQIAGEIEEVHLIRLEENQGYGGGIQAGLAHATGDFIGYTDADEQISADNSAMIFKAALDGQYDVVKAIRKVRQDGIQRLIVTTAYNALFRLMFGARSKDINAKPKVFKREALERLKLSARDWFIDAEAMIQAERLALSIKEIPIVFAARKHGSSNVRFSTMVEFLKNMWKYRHGQN